MEINKEKIEKLIFQSIQDFNDTEDEVNLKLSSDTVLYGSSSPIDSLGLVNIIILIEQRFSDDLNLDLTLADDRAMSEKNSPFKSISSLTKYIQKLITEIKSPKEN